MGRCIFNFSIKRTRGKKFSGVRVKVD